METFAWNDSHLTGEPLVDSEHRELVRIINWVGGQQPRQPAAPAEFNATLDQLVAHAVTHFAHEEELMASVGCDPRHVTLHQAVHADFARQVVAMRAVTLDAGDAESLLRFLASWLAYHIHGLDMSMTRQIHAIRQGMAPDEAYRRESDAQADPATANLLAALNSLYGVIASRNQALLELNLRLEQRVAERTRALQSANAELQVEHAELKAALAAVEATQRRLFESERQRSREAKRHMELVLAQIVDGNPVPTLVIDGNHRVTHWNQACAAITHVPATAMIGTQNQWTAFYPEERPLLADLIVSGALEQLDTHYPGKFRRSPIIEDAFEAEDFFPHFGDGGRWLYFTAAPLRDAAGGIIGAIETLQDVTERHRAEDDLRQYQASLEELVEKRTAQLAAANQQLAQDIVRREAAEAELRQSYGELTELNATLSETKEQLVQSEKLASIGQLAAGVAHEINNPIGYVHSNIGTLQSYLQDLFRVVDAYQEAEAHITSADHAERLQALRQEVDLGFLREDIPMLMGESKEGITRVKKIVQDLKDFSRVDSTQEWEWTNLHQGIDSTLNIVNNEIKYKADVVKEYGALPAVECRPSQLNQVFMNLLVNAAHAMGDQRGCITIRTGTAGDEVWLEFADNGSGIPEDIRHRIFDPFFTTKPVGKGTGLGLSLAYGIIHNHHGRITLDSAVGQGTTFRITLPVRQAEAVQENGNLQ